MIDKSQQPLSDNYFEIAGATREHGFTMSSDIMTCSLLQTLAASKPAGKFLELGTGTGLSTACILGGMDINSSLISIDNDKSVLEIAKTYLGHDSRLSLVLTDGEKWIKENRGQKFDFIFADTWHGKYLLLDEVLDMVNTGGLYIVDDMLPQPNWPEGHAEKAFIFMEDLKSNPGFFVTKQSWATGIIIAVKK